MLLKPEERVDFLKQVLIFNEFEDKQLAEVASRLKEKSYEAEEIIFHQGDASDKVFIILSGEVNVTRQIKDGKSEQLAILDSGDAFGEDGLFSKRERSATVKAISNTELFYLDENDFAWLRQRYPIVDPYLMAMSQTYQIVRKLKIRWLAEEETISLVARRHPIRLIMEWVVMLFILTIVIIILLVIGLLLQNPRITAILGFGLGGISSILVLIAGVWSYAEWQNDYFFVTNLRVVWRERILLRSSSRQEVPLRTIQSLDVQTSNFFARFIGVGDLVIRTFNSTMRLTEVKQPEQMRNMISAFLLKARQKSVRAQHAAIRRTIRQQLMGEDEEQQSSEPISKIHQDEKRWYQIFKTRIVDGAVITYRKHWFIFLQRAWKSTLAFLFTLLLSFIFSPRFFISAGIGGFCIISLLPLGTFAWWLYQYEDWRNDIYRLTTDRVIDRDKKPFGQESFRSAPIKNIQSVGHEIPSTIGLILNVGDVKINVGDETLTFDGVHDPALVHQDITRRMEEYQAGVENSRVSEEHNRMATWLRIYHEETNNGDVFEEDIPGPV